MKNVRLQVSENPYPYNDWWNSGWITIQNLGTINVNQDYLIGLNLDRPYYGFRIIGTGEIALSYYYARIKHFSILKEVICD